MSGKDEKTQGKTDGWGIPRTFERDLGGTRRPATKPAAAPQDDVPEDDEATYEELAAERYTGRSLVKQTTQVRDVATLYEQPWKAMSKAEMALLKNLGWSQPMWDTKMEASGRWPATYVTRFAKLTTTQREALRQLGFEAEEWDNYVKEMRGQA